MASNVQPQPARAGVPPQPPPNRRRLLLAALLALLLLGGGIGLAIALRGKSDGSGKDGGPRPGDSTEDEEVCSDDKDPKGLFPLEFGDPIRVSFSRKGLDALSEKPIPEVEKYPWQPKELVAVLGEHRMRGSHVAVLAGGKTLAVCAGDAFIRFGKVDTVHEETILPCPAATRLLLLSPAENTLAVCGQDNVIRLYDVRDPEKIPDPVVLETTRGQIGSLSWSGDGKYLLGGENSGEGRRRDACVWDVREKKIVNRLVHIGPVQGVAFSPVPGDYRA